MSAIDQTIVVAYIDQSFTQRYVAAKSQSGAALSIFMKGKAR